MSWHFTAVADCKDKLKAHCRKVLTESSYHSETMMKVADAHDALIDLFPAIAGRLIKIESNGHIDPGPAMSSNCKIDLTNYLPLVP